MVNKKNTKKINKEHRNIINIFKQKVLSDLKNIDKYLFTIKYDFNSKQKSEFLNLIYSKTFPGYQYVYKGLLSKSLNDINVTKYISFNNNGDLKKEIEWIVLILKKYEVELQKYLMLKNEYEHLLLEGKFGEAQETLKNINKNISYSLWGIEQMLVSSELYHGFEDNKRKLSEIADETNQFIVLFMSQYYSYKAEVDSTYNNFIHSISQLFDEKNESFGYLLYKDYLEFQFKLFDDNFDEKSLRRILSLSTTYSLIDLYENLIRICSIVVSSDSYSYEFRKDIISILMNINTDDHRKENMIIMYYPECLNLTRLNTENSRFVELVIEEYTMGNYKKCIDLISENSEMYDCFELLEVLIKSALYIDYDINNFSCTSSFFKNKILMPMYKIYACEDKENYLNVLLNSAKTIGNIDYKYKLLGFFSRHTNDVNEREYLYYNTIKEINSKVLTPRFYFVFQNNEKKQEYLDLLYKSNKYRSTLSLISAYVKCDFDEELMSKIPLERLKYYRIRANKKENLSNSISELESMLFEISNKEILNKRYKAYQYERYAIELYKMYLENMDISKSISIIVDSYILNKSSIVSMNKKRLCDLIEQHIYTNDIKLIIFYYLVDEKNYFNIYETLANFLDTNNMNLPSDLILWNEKHPSYFKEVNFILSKIYNKEIMKYFVRIDPKKRNEERIMTLNHLINVDEKNSNKYLEEINNIMKAQSIQERVKSVDEKKIFVDTEAILNEFEDIFKEKYRRYIALEELDHNLSFYDINELEEWEKYNLEISREINENQGKRQRYLMFKELINEFKIEILFNQKYGLAKFLSSRIRHGLLENNLSKTFKNYYLLSLKTNKDDNDFIVNKYWDDEINKHINELSEIHINKIKGILAEFSKKIIEKIGEVKDWIRIKDKYYPNGMFDYYLFSDEMSILSLYSITSMNIEYRTFYDEIINFFWSNTEQILEKVRQRINVELYEYFLNCLDELQHEVEKLKAENVSNELISNLFTKINLCRTILKSDLKQISNWFIVRRYGEYYNYNLGELVSTCFEINNKTNKKYSLIRKSVKIESDIYLKGKTFNYLIDVINILYSNAIQHSGFNKYEDMNIDIEISEIDSSVIADALERSGKFSSKEFRNSKYPSLRIIMKNLLEENKKSEDITGVINGIFEKISNSDKNLVSEEGGTGLTKINNILKYNIGALFFHQYLVDENNWFNAEIFLNLEYIIADKEEE